MSIKNTISPTEEQVEKALELAIGTFIDNFFAPNHVMSANDIIQHGPEKIYSYTNPQNSLDHRIYVFTHQYKVDEVAHFMFKKICIKYGCRNCEYCLYREVVNKINKHIDMTDCYNFIRVDIDDSDIRGNKYSVNGEYIFATVNSNNQIVNESKSNESLRIIKELKEISRKCKSGIAPILLTFQKDSENSGHANSIILQELKDGSINIVHYEPQGSKHNHDLLNFINWLKRKLNAKRRVPNPPLSSPNTKLGLQTYSKDSLGFCVFYSLFWLYISSLMLHHLNKYGRNYIIADWYLIVDQRLKKLYDSDQIYMIIYRFATSLLYDEYNKIHNELKPLQNIQQITLGIYTVNEYGTILQNKGISDADINTNLKNLPHLTNILPADVSTEYKIWKKLPLNTPVKIVKS
jgi:hypothetical protein